MKGTQKLRIGDLSAQSGYSTHAIRWYDAQGLIPGVVRDESGRRVFNPRHVSWLAFLARLKSTGMTIAQMRSYATLIAQGNGSLAAQRDLLAAHRECAVRVVEAWQASLKLIDAKLTLYDDWIATGDRPHRDGASVCAVNSTDAANRSAVLVRRRK